MYTQTKKILILVHNVNTASSFRKNRKLTPKTFQSPFDCDEENQKTLHKLSIHQDIVARNQLK